jgi:hypothetical protein
MIDIITGTYSVTRAKGPGQWGDDGKYKRGKSKVFEMQASVQPVSGNMIKLLPEHRRNSESVIIFSEERLFTSDEKSQRAADIIEYDGKCFEVFSVKKWSEFTDINHYESIAIMEDGQGGGNEI